MSEPLFTEADELTFRKAFAVQFLASYCAVNYNDYCSRGMQDMQGKPPVEDAEFLSKEAWEHWKNIMSISPPRPKGPPLNALRSFEAAARHGSFTVAAAELCVTPGAVAQQVKSLEAWSSAKLFKRKAHGIELTALGSSLLPEFAQAFDGLGAAIQSLRSQAMPEQIRIAALPSVAQHLLVDAVHGVLLPARPPPARRRPVCLPACMPWRLLFSICTSSDF